MPPPTIPVEQLIQSQQPAQQQQGGQPQIQFVPMLVPPTAPPAPAPVKPDAGPVKPEAVKQ
jgi:hypothetical protein